MYNQFTESAIKIVLVDDDPVANSIHQIVLKKAIPDASVRVFQLATHALEHLISEEPELSLLLLDLNMPELSGWEFLDQLARHPGKKPPVVILSSSSDPDDLRRSKEFDMVRGYWTKPLKSADVLDFLNPE